MLNAIIHRDYASSSDTIVKVFDSWIEIYNPGKLPTGLTIEKLLSGDYRSTLRNRKIADMFKEVGLVEKYGSGIGRIVQGFKEYGLPEPKFQEISDGFMVTVYAASVGQTAQDVTTQKSSVKSSVKILEAIQQNNSVTAVELSKQLGLTLRAVEKQLAKLKQQGTLRRIGPAKGGQWEIVAG